MLSKVSAPVFVLMLTWPADAALAVRAKVSGDVPPVAVVEFHVIAFPNVVTIVDEVSVSVIPWFTRIVIMT